MFNIWVLRRMKLVKIDKDLMLDVYIKEIRSLTEQGVAIWHSGLTQTQSKDLENIKKVALRIILSDDYKNYEDTCNLFDLKTLLKQRIQLCTNFVSLSSTKVFAAVNFLHTNNKEQIAELMHNLLLKT